MREGPLRWADWNGVHILQNRVVQVINTMQHELLHVLGLNGGRACREMFGANCDTNSGPGGPMFYFSHVPSRQFPESEMGWRWAIQTPLTDYRRLTAR